MAKVLTVKLKSKDAILKNHNLENKGKIHAFFTATCAKYMDRYVPYRSGDLATTVIENGEPTINVKEDTITYMQPYATYQYNGIRQDGTHPINEDNRTRSMHPDATSHWDNVMMSIHRTEIVKQVQEEYNRLGGK